MVKKRAAFVTLIMVFFAGVFAKNHMISYAGDINDNERAVIHVIRGTFEYDGKTYRAKQNYIDMAIAYLAADEMDLTAEQRDNIISEVYNNVRNGIESGYLEVFPSGPAPESEVTPGQPEGGRGEPGSIPATEPTEGILSLLPEENQLFPSMEESVPEIETQHIITDRLELEADRNHNPDFHSEIQTFFITDRAGYLMVFRSIIIGISTLVIFSAALSLRFQLFHRFARAGKEQK